MESTVDIHSKKQPSTQNKAVSFKKLAIAQESLLCWKKFFNLHSQTMHQHADKIHPDYLNGLKVLNLSESSYPCLLDLNRCLKKTGWQAISVKGYLSTWLYVHYLSRNLFPIGMGIRSSRDSHFSPIPDFIHDVIGHLPMLFSSDYRLFLRTLVAKMFACGQCPQLEAINRAQASLGKLEASRADSKSIAEKQLQIEQLKILSRDKPSQLWQLSNLMLWTLEFGLIKEKEALYAYGAGILSAPKEISAFDPKKHPQKFSPKILNKDYLFTKTQKTVLPRTVFCGTQNLHP